MAYQTYTNLGIDSAVAEYSTSTRPVTKNIVVITDGASNDPAATVASANTAISQGIRLFAVGIGSGVNYDELLAITGDPDRVYTASNFDSLAALLAPVSDDVCN